MFFFLFSQGNVRKEVLVWEYALEFQPDFPHFYYFPLEKGINIPDQNWLGHRVFVSTDVVVCEEIPGAPGNKHSCV